LNGENSVEKGLKMSKRAFLLALAFLALATTLGYAALSPTQSVSSFGKVQAIGCEVDRKSINWGVLTPGQLKHETLRVNITGNVDTVLQLETANWKPPQAQQYIYLSSNYYGEVLKPGTVLLLDLTLYVSPSIHDITYFSFDIIITAVQA
jgi:hypothetical protein